MDPDQLDSIMKPADLDLHCFKNEVIEFLKVMCTLQLLGKIWKQTYRYSLSLLYASVFSFFIFGITSLSSSKGALIAYFSFVIVFHIVVLTALTGF